MERSERGSVLPVEPKGHFIPGEYRTPKFMYPVGLSLYMCNVRGFTGCESCMRPISTKPANDGRG